MNQSTSMPLGPADFAPLIADHAAERIARPSLSYWQDAWRRLKQNQRAVVSLYIVLSLIFFTVFGPWIWQVSPATQVLDEISLPPSHGRTAMLVEDYQHWRGIHVDVEEPALRPAAPGDLLGPTGLVLIDEPSTNAVRIRWNPVVGASGYAIYRHELEPSGPNDLGLPLGDTNGAGAVSFEDRLGLEARRYYYSVIPMLNGMEGKEYSVIEVRLKPSVTVSEAQYRGLIDADANPSELIGQDIQLYAHPLGTDYLGRDILARIIEGARTSLFIGITAPLIYVMFGMMYGGLSGYFGGRIDNIMMRFADFVIALPFLLFMILFKISFGIGPGESGVMPMLVAMILLGWPATARLVRGQVLQIREEPYIQAARLMGAEKGYLIFRHMLPNVMGVLLVSLTFAIPSAIFTEAFLSFIGMGVVPPTPSWGSMCNDGIRTMLSTPHELVVPALFISITVLAFNLLGDGLRDAMDARMRSK